MQHESRKKIGRPNRRAAKRSHLGDDAGVWSADDVDQPSAPTTNFERRFCRFSCVTAYPKQKFLKVHMKIAAGTEGGVAVPSLLSKRSVTQSGGVRVFELEAQISGGTPRNQMYHQVIHSDHIKRVASDLQ